MVKEAKSLSGEFKELEAIAEKFEGGISLEEGIKEFERGLQLAQHLKRRLSKIEKQIEVIKEKYVPPSEEVSEEELHGTF